MTGRLRRPCSRCGTPLSRYNPTEVCAACTMAAERIAQAAAGGDVDDSCPTCGHTLNRPVDAAHDVGQRIADLRVALKLTQQELADKAGLSKSLVAQLEGGFKKSSRFGTLSALAGALGVPPGVLLEAPAAAERERTPGGRHKQRRRVGGSWRWP